MGGFIRFFGSVVCLAVLAGCEGDGYDVFGEDGQQAVQAGDDGNGSGVTNADPSGNPSVRGGESDSDANSGSGSDSDANAGDSESEANANAAANGGDVDVDVYNGGTDVDVNVLVNVDAIQTAPASCLCDCSIPESFGARCTQCDASCGPTPYVSVCDPGQSVECACGNHVYGSQTCVLNGSGWGTCFCPNTSAAPTVIDSDGDGFSAGNDCNDGNPYQWSYNSYELCGDGADNNCNGIIDEGCPGAPPVPDMRDDDTECAPGRVVACPACGVGYQGYQQCAADGSGWGACECPPAPPATPVCQAGLVQACPCLNGATGSQTCVADGSFWGACQCPEGTGGSGNVPATGGVGGTGGTSGSGGAAGTGGSGNVPATGGSGNQPATGGSGNVPATGGVGGTGGTSGDGGTGNVGGDPGYLVTYQIEYWSEVDWPQFIFTHFNRDHGELYFPGQECSGDNRHRICRITVDPALAWETFVSTGLTGGGSYLPGLNWSTNRCTMYAEVQVSRDVNGTLTPVNAEFWRNVQGNGCHLVIPAYGVTSSDCNGPEGDCDGDGDVNSSDCAVFNPSARHPFSPEDKDVCGNAIDGDCNGTALLCGGQSGSGGTGGTGGTSGSGGSGGTTGGTGGTSGSGGTGGAPNANIRSITFEALNNDPGQDLSADTSRLMVVAPVEQYVDVACQSATVYDPADNNRAVGGFRCTANVDRSQDVEFQMNVGSLWAARISVVQNGSWDNWSDRYASRDFRVYLYDGGSPVAASDDGASGWSDECWLVLLNEQGTAHVECPATW